MFDYDKIKRTQIEWFLHEVASASIAGALMIAPFAALLTGLSFSLMNRALGARLLHQQLSGQRSPRSRGGKQKLPQRHQGQAERPARWEEHFDRATVQMQAQLVSRQVDPAVAPTIHGAKNVSSKQQVAFAAFKRKYKLGELDFRVGGHPKDVVSLLKDVSDQKKAMRRWFVPTSSRQLYFAFKGKKDGEKCKRDHRCDYANFAAFLVVSLRRTEALTWSDLELSAALHVAVLNKYGTRVASWAPVRVFEMLRQTTFFFQLKPTRSSNEPVDAGRWMLHQLKDILKREYAAAELFLEDKSQREHLGRWIGLLLHRLFVQRGAQVFAKKQTLLGQVQWLSFMNGVDGWGGIQWLSTFFALVALLMLLSRLLLVRGEMLSLRNWSYQHPDVLRKHATENRNLIRKLRQDASYKASAFPEPRRVAAMNLLDPKTKQDEGMLQGQLESSRRVVEFLITSLASIGFIGTITGIAFAINDAYKVVTPDAFARLQAIKNLSSSLSLAFSTTFVALLLTLICDFWAKRQWRTEDRMIEEFAKLKQTWTYAEGQSLFEQTKNSVMPEEI